MTLEKLQNCIWMRELSRSFWSSGFRLENPETMFTELGRMFPDLAFRICPLLPGP